MNLFFDSFWRAAAYCVRPRVIALSFLPLVLMVTFGMLLGYFFWEMAIDWVRGALDALPFISTVWSWLDGVGAGRIKVVLAPLIVIFCVTPVIVVLSLLLVALLMTPTLTALVARRRFAELERKHGGSVLASVLWSFGSALLALLVIVVSMPLWLVPPLILVLPPLIWGWLTYRVMAFDALADHASAAERRELFQRHRAALLGMGVFCGYLGAAPSLLWASGVLFAAAFMVLVPLAIWIYTLVFAFSSLWFAHYCLGALQALRAGTAVRVDPAVAVVPKFEASPESTSPNGSGYPSAR